MGRISPQHLATAIQTVSDMDLQEKRLLADEVGQEQPHLMGSVYLQRDFGVSSLGLDFLLSILLVCYQAMKESGLKWSCVSAEALVESLHQCIADLLATDDFGPDRALDLLRQLCDAHLEGHLLAWVATETSAWLNLFDEHESNKFVILEVLNIVNCIAYAPLVDTIETGVN